VIALPGVIETLAVLKEMGMILAVGTNDAEENAVAQMNALGIADKFQHIHGADSGYGAKPGGGMISAFGMKVNQPVSSVMMVGDSTHDLQAGRAAGAICCGVETGPATKNELAPFADVVLGSIADIPQYLA